MTFMLGLCHELPKKPEKQPKPLKIVTCMTKNPLCCCVASFIIPILLSFMGMRTLIQNSGAVGPFKVGVNYPNFDLIARNLDALTIAREESSLALLGTSAASVGSGWGRRALAAEGAAEGESESSHDFQMQLPSGSGSTSATGMNIQIPSPSSVALSSVRRQLQSSGSGGSSAAQIQQSEFLALAQLVVSARDGVTNLLDDAGLTQLCTFRDGLMKNEPTFLDYCLKKSNASGAPFSMCNPGNDILSMLYGAPSYDIDTINLSVFATPSFDDIMLAVASNDIVALASYPPADVAAISSLATKLFGYLLNDWQDYTYVCQDTYKKDVPKVLAFLAELRAKQSLQTFNGILNQYLDKEFTSANPVTRYTKGMYYYGAPTCLVATTGVCMSNYIEQAAKATQDEDYQVWWTAKKFRQFYPEGPSPLWPTGQPTVLNSALILQEILIVLLGDGIRAILPVLLVFFIVWLQTGSLLIAFVTVFEVAISLTVAIFVTTVVLQIKWLSAQAPLALYVVIAIGADDVFVFVDAYKQSFYAGAEVNSSLLTRMSWVYRRAGLAMLITSLTTCSAFIASALASPIPELQNFGMLTAFVIFIDYVMVMTLLCANVILWHNYFEIKPNCCIACCVKEKDGKGGCDRLCDFKASEFVTTTMKAAEGMAEKTKKSKAVVFFEDTFPFNMVVKPIGFRITSMAVCLLCLVLGIVSSLNIEPQTSTENFLPDNHPFQRYINIQSNFAASNFDTTVEMQFVWGFKEDDPLDQTGVNLIFDADNKGEPNYLPTFELTPAAQTALLAACDAIAAANATKVEINTETGVVTVMSHCFLQAFQAYRNYKGLSFPVPTSQIESALESWLSDYDPTGSLPAGADAHSDDYVSDIGWTKLPSGELKLSWFKVRAFSKIGERGLMTAIAAREKYDEWEAVLAEANAITAPTPLGSAFQTSGLQVGTGNKWIYMTVQEAYVRMALTGAAIGLAIATIVLLLATRNLIVTLGSVFSIASALMCVIGTIVAMGWQLGSNESLCIMVLTGFAVDYVVHLSHAYMESTSLNRLDRTHDALRDLGISVFWGMLTSVISAGVLATCQIQSLSKFGVFFMLTIIYAYLWAMFFLMPLLATIGPQPKGGGSSGAASSEVPKASPVTHEVA